MWNLEFVNWPGLGPAIAAFRLSRESRRHRLFASECFNRR